MAARSRSQQSGPGPAARVREGSRTRTRPILLDGDALAGRRAPALADRARAVARARGWPPRLVLIAFADAAGRAAYSAKKLRASAAVGVEAVPLIVPFGSDTAYALRALRRALDDETLDAAFLEFPFPDDIDGDALTQAIPPKLDVDVMTSARIRDFTTGTDPRPPLTAEAALALMDGYDVDIAGRSCVVVADASPFASMFAEAFARRGASSSLVVSPDAADLSARLRGAGIAIIAAGRPGLVPASLLAPGAVAIDAGYFNPGGRGDIDASAGIAHLEAFAPVPGGIGPMTISALIERVIEFAEAGTVVK